MSLVRMGAPQGRKEKPAIVPAFSVGSAGAAQPGPQRRGNAGRPAAGDAGDPHLGRYQQFVAAQYALVQPDRGAADLGRRGFDHQFVVEMCGTQKVSIDFAPQRSIISSAGEICGSFPSGIRPF